MNLGLFAKIAGWIQLLLQGMVTGVPHTVEDWITLIASALIGGGVHAASSSGPKP